MNSDQLLLLIKEELQKEGLDCSIETFDPSSPKRLLVYTGEDSNKRYQFIEIKANTLEMNDTDPSLMSLQLQMIFPFLVEDIALSDVAQFLQLLNLQLEVPGFYLNHVDNTILYRYVFFFETEHLPKKILKSLIGIVMFLQDVFGPVLERLAKGQTSFLDLMQDIQKLLEKSKT